MDDCTRREADQTTILETVQVLEAQLEQETTPLKTVLATAWALVTNLKCASALDEATSNAVDHLIRRLMGATPSVPALKRVIAELGRFRRSDGGPGASVADRGSKSNASARAQPPGGDASAEPSLLGAADALLRSVQRQRPDGVREGLLALSLMMGCSPHAAELGDRASILLRRGVADALALSLGHSGPRARALPLDVRGVLGYFLASAAATGPAYRAALEGLEKSPAAKEARAVLKLVLKQPKVAVDAAQRIRTALEAAGVPADGTERSAQAAWALARGGTMDILTLVGARGPRVLQAEQEATANQERVDAMQRLSHTGAWSRMLLLGDSVLPSAQWKTMTPSQQQTALRLTTTAIERCVERSTLNSLSLDALRAGESLTRLHLANARFTALRPREARRAKGVRDRARAPFHQALQRRMSEEQAFQNAKKTFSEIRGLERALDVDPRQFAGETQRVVQRLRAVRPAAVVPHIALPQGDGEARAVSAGAAVPATPAGVDAGDVSQEQAAPPAAGASGDKEVEKEEEELFEEQVGQLSVLFDRVAQAALTLERRGDVAVGDTTRLRLRSAVEDALAALRGTPLSRKLATQLRMGHLLGQCARAALAGPVADPWLGVALLALAVKCPTGVTAPKSVRKGITATRHALGAVLGPEAAGRLVHRACPTPQGGARGGGGEGEGEDRVVADLLAAMPVGDHPASPQSPRAAAEETWLVHAVVDALADAGSSRGGVGEDTQTVRHVHQILVRTVEEAGAGPWTSGRGARALMGASEVLLSDSLEGKRALRDWRRASHQSHDPPTVARFAAEIDGLKRIISAVAALGPMTSVVLRSRSDDLVNMAAAWTTDHKVSDTMAECGAQLVSHAAAVGGALSDAARKGEAVKEQGRAERAEMRRMDGPREEEEARKVAVMEAAEARLSALVEETGQNEAGLDGRQVVAQAAGVAAWEAARELDLAAPPAVPAVAPEVEAAVSRWLDGILARAEPSASQAAARDSVLQRARKLCQGRDSLHLFGSSASGFGTPFSDIDMCMVVEGGATLPRQTAKRIIYRSRSLAERMGFVGLEAVAHARIPILKMRDPDTGLDCDICFNNTLALRNTALLRCYCDIDPRARELGLAVKAWAKARDVNSARFGTLSSYAYVLWVITFLQRLDPPVLPLLQSKVVLSALGVEQGAVGRVDTTFADDAEAFRGFGKRNTASTAQLLVAFFHDAAGFPTGKKPVMCPREGLLCDRDKRWRRPKRRIDPDFLCESIAPLYRATPRHLTRPRPASSIADPFELARDLGCVLQPPGNRRILAELRRAAELVRRRPPAARVPSDPLLHCARATAG